MWQLSFAGMWVSYYLSSMDRRGLSQENLPWWVIVTKGVKPVVMQASWDTIEKMTLGKKGTFPKKFTNQAAAQEYAKTHASQVITNTEPIQQPKTPALVQDLGIKWWAIVSPTQEQVIQGNWEIVEVAT